MLSRLATALGASQAKRELRWMRAAVDSAAVATDLDAMVARRVRGEPLQYILGNPLSIVPVAI